MPIARARRQIDGCVTISAAPGFCYRHEASGAEVKPMIVDTHVHVVAADQDKYQRKIADWNNEWVADTTDGTILKLMDEAGIDRTMLVQA
jgi:hypothetical protein